MLKTNNIYKPGEPVYKMGIPPDEKKQGGFVTDKQGLSIDEHWPLIRILLKNSDVEKKRGRYASETILDAAGEIYPKR